MRLDTEEDDEALVCLVGLCFFFPLPRRDLLFELGISKGLREGSDEEKQGWAEDVQSEFGQEQEQV
jgi:hypothetical protein